MTDMALPDRIDVVFCDVGGPIYPDESYTAAVHRALDEIRAEHGSPPADQGDFDRVYDHVRAQQTGGLRRSLARELLGDEALGRTLHERTSEHWAHPAGTAYADALELFKTLHGHVRLGVVANQEAAAVDALRRDGFGDYIDIWGISAIVGHEKPSRELFDWALVEAGTTAKHAVHIGNRLDTDVRPAKALGMGTVWVVRGEAPEHPTAEQLAEADVAVRELTPVADLVLERARP